MNLDLSPSALLTNLRQLLSNDLSVSDRKIKPIKKILVAYSGGLDSHVLLHLLSRIPRDGFYIRAVYINHGLQLESAEWADHCEQVCKNLDIRFNSINLNLEIAKGESLEELARKARYKALYTELEADEILVTAHHQTDQAETFLLQLFRGAGVQGLAAMPQITEIKYDGKTIQHARPLINQSRQALEAYAQEFDLKPIEDPSNKDTAFDRNFLRQKIMPELRQRWLGIDKAISRSAAIQAETKTLLDEIAQQELCSVLAPDWNIDNNTVQFSILAPILIPQFLTHSEAKQRLLLRYWISQQGFATPSVKKLQHIFSDVILADNDKQPLVFWRGAELRRYKQYLYIMPPLTAHDAMQVIPWQGDSPIHIASIDVTLEPKMLKMTSDNITIRFRQGGESIQIPKRGNINLKNLFQEYQVPPWLRSRLPLIYIGEKLVKIVGLEAFNRHPPTY